MQGLRSSRMHALAFQSLCFSSRTQSCTVSFLPFLLSSWPCLSVTSFLPDPSPGILVSPIFSSLSVPLPVVLPFLLFYCICNELKFPSILLSFFSLLSHSLSSRPFLLCSPSLFFSRSLFLFLFPSAFSLYSLFPNPHLLLSPFPVLFSLSLLLSLPSSSFSFLLRFLSTLSFPPLPLSSRPSLLCYPSLYFFRSLFLKVPLSLPSSFLSLFLSLSLSFFSLSSLFLLSLHLPLLFLLSFLPFPLYSLSLLLSFPLPVMWRSPRPRTARARAAGTRNASTGSLVFGGFAFPPVSLGPAGDCPCKD